jgi:hypothetical protein
MENTHTLAFQNCASTRFCRDRSTSSPRETGSTMRTIAFGPRSRNNSRREEGLNDVQPLFFLSIYATLRYHQGIFKGEVMLVDLLVDLFAFLFAIGTIFGIAYVGIRYRIFKEEWERDDGEETKAANTEDDLFQRDSWSK